MRDVSGHLRFLDLDETRESLRIAQRVLQRPDTEELPRADLFRRRRESFRRKYIEFLGRVNERNHSLAWWSMPFTDKNPFDPPLCRLTAHFLLIVDLLRPHNSNAGPLLVITSNTDLAAQVREWAAAEAITVVDSVKAPWSWRRFLKRHTPGGIAKSSLRTFYYWLGARKLKPQANHADGHVLITTLSHPRSFSGPDGYRDAYFGPLVDHLAASQQKAVVLALVVEQPGPQYKKLRGLDFQLPVLPIESCLSLGDLINCSWQALKLYLKPFRLNGPVEIDGVDLTCLVTRTISDARHSGNPFMNMRLFYSARWLAKNIRLRRCLYIYENLPWERMLLLGVRAGSPETQIVGFQHASVTLSHTNLIMAAAETAVVPAPDMILTTGEVVKEWLETEGNYPAGAIKTGCALRQGRSPATASRQRSRRLDNILVILSTSLEEYAGILSFMDKASDGLPGRQLRLRPHPSIPIEWVLDSGRLDRRDFFSTSSGSLVEDLQWADVVLFASSTVSMEALSLGIPVVYLDLGEILDTDPLLSWEEFKWTAREPSALPGIILDLESIPDDDFKTRQQKGRDYVDSYLSPVTDAGILAFLES